MQKLSNTKLLSVVSLLLVLLLLAKLASVALWWYLPSEGVELNAKKSYLAKYQRVHFSNMLVFSKIKAENGETSVNQVQTYSINSLVLKGLYGNKLSGFVIVAKKENEKETSIVGVGEEYAGYKLKKIALTEVIFTKANKDYILALEKPGDKKFTQAIKRVKHEKNSQLDEHIVTKQDIKNYSKNPSKIWKDIAISPFKKDGKIEGFKVNRIKAGSKMATLGLKKGDIIIRANNIKLSSLNDALKLYKDIDKIDTLELVVIRNNQEKEIIYEIH
ncbi:hypothetical protein JHD49_03775 [Sulfurimonas sp. SAG-AH-194-C21]|nr:hypothetical protein [Sulfurimonas sp. SAG-AH-194-C21]MDF1883050.1 hypothetical protein [Sulfurimonas sp. SAG-AH-194-C21]